MPSSSSLLSEALDQRQRMARNAQQDSVGPFALGGIGPRIDANEKVKKWNELDAKGKGLRSVISSTRKSVK